MAFDNILHLYKETYYRMPQSLKTFLGSIYGNIPLQFRFGRPYKTHLEIAKKFEQGSQQFQLDFLYNKTLETLQFAEENIPYYRDTFALYGVSSRDFRSPSDINRFPGLTKEDVKYRLQDLFTDCAEKPTAYYTGGSTSVPTKYYLPLFTSRGKEKAYNEHIFSKIGKTNRKKTLLLKGREVAQPGKEIYWEHEPVDNFLVVSSNYLNSDAFTRIYKKVRAFAPEFVFGYPSAILEFIRSVRGSGADRFSVQGVILTAEMVYSHEIQEIEEFFQAKALVKYGHSERAGIGYKIGTHDYSFLNSYGLIRSDSREIVTTGFDNFVMPFINYRTNDFLSGEMDFYPDTDIVHSSDDIEGRLQEHLVTLDGRLISICVMGAGHYSSLADVDAIQYQQEEAGKVTLLVESRHQVNTSLIKDELEAFTKQGIQFDVKHIDGIEKSTRGKRIMCKQHLDIDRFRT